MRGSFIKLIIKNRLSKFDTVVLICSSFQGCYTHGHLLCIKDRQKKLYLAQGLTANQAYIQTLQKVRKLETLGYTVVQKWSCELEKELKENPEMREFFDSISFPDYPLDPRSALFGGRTGGAVLYHKVQDGQEIHYCDVTSL